MSTASIIALLLSLFTKYESHKLQGNTYQGKKQPKPIQPLYRERFGKRYILVPLGKERRSRIHYNIRKDKIYLGIFCGTHNAYYILTRVSYRYGENSFYYQCLFNTVNGINVIPKKNKKSRY